MSGHDIINATQWFFLIYFILLNGGYIFLNILAIFGVFRYMQGHEREAIQPAFSEYQPPVSILVPAYNEEATVAATVRSITELNYGEFEIIVINDGSTDKTLNTLITEFDMVPFPEAYRVRIKTKPIKGIYLSLANRRVRVIAKENGGKADALNAGINAARYPLFCAVDADSALQLDSLQRVILPFLEDPKTIACGGTVRIANGCTVKGGFLEKIGLPSNILALFQIMEYIRAFLFGRLGWSTLNALLIISGAFGVFKKELVIEAGGYRTDTVGEDMELVVRLHRMMRLRGRPYTITFVPDPICWTEVPEDLKTLKNQRVRWQRGLAESLWLNIDLLFHSKGGTISWLAFPFMVFFEWLGPLFEVGGYVFTITAYLLGAVSYDTMLAFFMVAIGMGLMLSVTSLFLEEMSFHVYEKPKHVLVLFIASILENFGYRQINSLWRLIGLLQWATGRKGHWGKMKRVGTWAKG
jgi:cellulose synthase/poly-beta-1,6-N-acetylglucosamine synthase-like glycosyltransferase